MVIKLRPRNHHNFLQKCTEYEILQGAKESLNKTLIVETETMFYQIYSGQKLAPDIMNLMNLMNFISLIYLEPCLQCVYTSGN